MDPIENMKEQLALARAIDRDTSVPHGAYNSLVSIGVKSVRLADLVLALDAWRRKGGFDPYGGPFKL